MKKVIIENPETINLNNISVNTSIFVMKDGKLMGMLSYEVIDSGLNNTMQKGWITKIGKDYGVSGYYGNREDTIRDSMKYGFEFFVES